MNMEPHTRDGDGALGGWQTTAIEATSNDDFITALSTGLQASTVGGQDTER
jgi:hypothetical protein